MLGGGNTPHIIHHEPCMLVDGVVCLSIGRWVSPFGLLAWSAMLWDAGYMSKGQRVYLHTTRGHHTPWATDTTRGT